MPARQRSGQVPTWVCCIVYLDDILIYSATREEHTAYVLQVLDRL